MTDEYYGDPNPRETLEVFEEFLEIVKDGYEDYEPPAIQSEIDIGVYSNAYLETPDEDVCVFSLSRAYFWTTTFGGRPLVDIPDEEIPGGVDLEECRLQIDSSDGVPLIGGAIVEVGQRDGLGGATTVVVGGQHDD